MATLATHPIIIGSGGRGCGREEGGMGGSSREEKPAAAAAKKLIGPHSLNPFNAQRGKRVGQDGERVRERERGGEREVEMKR